MNQKRFLNGVEYVFQNIIGESCRLSRESLERGDGEKALQYQKV